MDFQGATAERNADAIEAAAFRDFYAAAPAALRLRVEDVAGAAVLIAPTLPVSFFNRVIGLGNASPATAGDIAAIRTLYADAGIADYIVHAVPSAEPANLADLLRDDGFAPGQRRSWAKFLRAPADVPRLHTDLKLREADTADATAVASAVTTAFGMPSSVGPWFAALIGRPGWRLWVAQAGDQVIATGALYVRGDQGWLGAGATLAEHRGRGAQTALLATRIRAAAELGCCVVATETGEPVADEPNPSLANIRRAGFVQVCSRLNYVPV